MKKCLWSIAPAREFLVRRSGNLIGSGGPHQTRAPSRLSVRLPAKRRLPAIKRPPRFKTHIGVTRGLAELDPRRGVDDDGRPSVSARTECRAWLGTIATTPGR